MFHPLYVPILFDFYTPLARQIVITFVKGMQISVLKRGLSDWTAQHFRGLIMPAVFLSITKEHEHWFYVNFFKRYVHILYVSCADTYALEKILTFTKYAALVFDSYTVIHKGFMFVFCFRVISYKFSTDKMSKLPTSLIK